MGGIPASLGAMSHQPAYGIYVEGIFGVNFNQSAEHDGGRTRVSIPVPVVAPTLFPVGAGR